MNRTLLCCACVIAVLGKQPFVQDTQAAQTASATSNAANAPPFALVKTINAAPHPRPAALLSLPNLFVTVGNTVLFSAFTPQTGDELWRTDGTEVGTTLVKDINSGANSSLHERLLRRSGVDHARQRATGR